MSPRKAAKRLPGEILPEPGTTWKERYRAEKIAASNRAAKSQPCPRCGAPTLVGLDEDVMAAAVRVDPPLGLMTDRRVWLRVQLALVTGRRVCALIGDDLHDMDRACLRTAYPRVACIHHRCGDTTLHLPPKETS